MSLRLARGRYAVNVTTSEGSNAEWDTGRALRDHRQGCRQAAGLLRRASAGRSTRTIRCATARSSASRTSRPTAWGSAAAWAQAPTATRVTSPSTSPFPTPRRRSPRRNDGQRVMGPEKVMESIEIGLFTDPEKTWSASSTRAERVQAPFAGHALQLVRAAVLELEARAGDEVLDGARDEHLAGAACAATRAPMCTAIPPTLSSISSHSPVWRPARTSMPSARTASGSPAHSESPGPGRRRRRRSRRPRCRSPAAEARELRARTSA